VPRLASVTRVTAPAVAPRPRAFVRVAGPQAEDYLQRMLSNDVAALGPGEACDALLLTAKARLLAPLRVLRRGHDDFLLLTEPELGETVRRELVRMRFAARCEVEPEEHSSFLLVGDDTRGIPTRELGVPAAEVLDEHEPEGAATLGEEEVERLRILARTPRWGRELDDRVLPAEAGLTETHVSFTKGCYPGQEPIARLHYRGHANRGLRALRLETDEPPGQDAELRFDGKTVGRVTSAVRDSDGVLALAYVRREVPADAVLDCDGVAARQL
jgi:tRNA-modifying protein YgfZ